MPSTGNELAPWTTRDNLAWSYSYATGLYQNALTVALGIALAIPIAAPTATPGTTKIPVAMDTLMTAACLVVPYFLSMWVLTYMRYKLSDALWADRRERSAEASAPGADAPGAEAPEPVTPSPC